MWLRNDQTRYNTLIVLHTISAAAFLLRFIIIYTDLTSAKSDAIAYPVVILLLELGSSLVTLVADFFYLFLRYIGAVLYESDRNKVTCCSQSFAWSFGTLTCIRCQCHGDHPRMILLTRFIMLLVFEIMRFIAFILACVCANRYAPIGLGYAILGGFSLGPDIAMVVIEYLHYHRLWVDYHPDVAEGTEKPTYSPRHDGFIPIAMTNDRLTNHWQRPRCDQGEECPSRSLYHILMYHSANTRYPDKSTENNQKVVGFHQTSHQAAFAIAKTNFRHSKDGWIGPGTYFATSLNHTEFKANQFGAYICAEVDLGRTMHVTRGAKNDDSDIDTIYLKHALGADEFCVRKLDQIRSWVIIIDEYPMVRSSTTLADPNFRSPDVKDHLDSNAYVGCFS